MKRWYPLAYLAVALTSTALAAVQPERVPDAEWVAWLAAPDDAPVAGSAVR